MVRNIKYDWMYIHRSAHMPCKYHNAGHCRLRGMDYFNLSSLWWTSKQHVLRTSINQIMSFFLLYTSIGDKHACRGSEFHLSRTGYEAILSQIGTYMEIDTREKSMIRNCCSSTRFCSVTLANAIIYQCDWNFGGRHSFLQRSKLAWRHHKEFNSTPLVPHICLGELGQHCFRLWP